MENKSPKSIKPANNVEETTAHSTGDREAVKKKVWVVTGSDCISSVYVYDSKEKAKMRIRAYPTEFRIHEREVT